MGRRSTSQHGSTRRPRRPAPDRGRRARGGSSRTARFESAVRAASFPLIVVLVVFAMCWYLYPLVRMRYAGQREVERLELELAEIRGRNEELSEEVDRLRTPEGVEEAARESLGYVKPGERACVVLPAQGVEESSVVTPEAEVLLAEETPSWWRKVLDYVFGVGS